MRAPYSDFQLDSIRASPSFEPVPPNPIALAELTPLQRASGSAEIVLAAGGLQRLYQDGCAKIRLPRDAAARSTEAVLINTSGGLTGGDRLEWRAAARGAHLTLTTQACEKVYRARDGHAETQVSLSVGEGAQIDWLPQETILFNEGALARRLEADLARDARLLVVEALVLGRTAMDETVRRGELHDCWRIRREGRLVFADDLRISGPIATVANSAPVLAGAAAFASILFVAHDAERLLWPLRASIGEAGGASAFEGKLFARIVAADGFALRRALLPAIAVLRDGEPLPRVWRT